MTTRALLLVATATATVSKSSSQNTFGKDRWEAWKIKHHKKYASVAEEARRFAIFDSHRQRIDASHTSFKQGLAWEGMDQTPDELSKLRGYRHDGEALDTKPLFKPADAKLPPEVDWRKQHAVTDVKQQGQGSSCWSFSSAGAIEGAVSIASGKPAVSVSNQQIMDCSGVDCLDAVNGTMTKAFHNIIAWGGGLDADASYPYIDKECVSWDALCNPSMLDPRCKYWCPPHKCQSNHTAIAMVTAYTHTAVGNESALTYAVATYGPIAVAMDASQSDFAAYQSGVYSNPHCGSDKDSLDHAVLLIGYGTTTKGEHYYLVKNSWGVNWGMGGFFMIARNQNNMCGLATDASFPTAKPAGPSPPGPTPPKPAPSAPPTPAPSHKPAPAPVMPAPAKLQCTENSAQKQPCGGKYLTTKTACLAAFGGNKCCWDQTGTDIWCYNPIPQ